MNKNSPVSYFTRSLKYAGLVFLFSRLFYPSQLVYAAEQEQPKTDLRVIIDISGSMKKSDPENLRRPALRLLAGLIPAGSRAGVWNFGHQVNMTVKIGDVNDAWREMARKQSEQISSVGLFTNIESAMRKASFGWDKPDPRYKRNLILLTDGHVDVANNDAENKASKSRIIHEILPALEKAKVKIHSIALSDDVDESLLSTLSAYTNGLYKKVSNADDLQKIFLQMLEQSANLDSIPLDNNSFKVDNRIEDMTLLVFNSDKNSPTRIITPAQQSWTEKQNAKQVKWFHDQGYDLLTIKKPRQGEWKIVAPQDKNNRVVVATNLKLKVNELPGYMMPGDMINVTAELLEDGKPLKDKRLLSKFAFTVEKKVKGQEDAIFQMSAPGNDDNKSYFTLPSSTVAGVNELIIRVKSPTAEREIHHQFRVYTTVADVAISEKHGKFRVEVRPFENLLKPASIKINAVLNDKSEHPLKQQDNAWVVEIDKKYQGSVLDLNLQAVRADTKPFSMTFQEKLEVTGSAGALTIEKNEPGKHKPVMTPGSTSGSTSGSTPGSTKGSSKDKKDAKDKKGHHTDKKKMTGDETGDENGRNKKTKSPVENAKVNWTLIIISIASGNLLLLGMFAGGYLFIKRRKDKMSASLKNEMSEDS